MSQLLLRQNKNIEFTDEEARAVLKGDFSLKIIDGPSNLPSVSKKPSIPNLIFGIVIGLIAVVAIFYIIKHFGKNRKNINIGAGNINKKTISYAKI